MFTMKITAVIDDTMLRGGISIHHPDSKVVSDLLAFSNPLDHPEMQFKRLTEGDETIGISAVFNDTLDHAPVEIRELMGKEAGRIAEDIYTKFNIEGGQVTLCSVTPGDMQFTIEIPGVDLAAFVVYVAKAFA